MKKWFSLWVISLLILTTTAYAETNVDFVSGFSDYPWGTTYQKISDDRNLTDSSKLFSSSTSKQITAYTDTKTSTEKIQVLFVFRESNLIEGRLILLGNDGYDRMVDFLKAELGNPNRETRTDFLWFVKGTVVRATQSRIEEGEIIFYSALDINQQMTQNN